MSVTVALSEVLSVYSGKQGCCCGCLGKHFYHEDVALRAEGGKRRGYPVQDEECSDKQIKRILGIINRGLDSEDNGDHVSLLIGKRLYVVYRKPTTTQAPVVTETQPNLIEQ